jgi:hypothetical protein
MKIRKGFVSNSSSSSFVAFGAELEQDDFIELYENAMNKKVSEEDEEELYNLCEELREKIDLEVLYDDGGIIYIGRSFLDGKDDETFKQFRDSVREKIHKYLPKCKLDDIDTTIYG